MFAWVPFRADTFTASFNRLSGHDQKAVKATVFDLQMGPGGNGLQLHRIDIRNAGDFARAFAQAPSRPSMPMGCRCCWWKP